MIGLQASGASLRALTDHPIRPDLVLLGERELVNSRHEDEYEFTHPLIREVAYEATLKQRRAVLHEQVADWIDGDGVQTMLQTAATEESGRRLSQLEVLGGTHLERAYRLRQQLGQRDPHVDTLVRRAAAKLAGAGRAAFEQDDTSTAVDLLERSTARLPADDAGRLELAPVLGEALIESGAYERAERMLGHALVMARRLGDRRLEGHVRLRLVMLRELVDTSANCDANLAETREALRLLDEEDDAAGVLEARIQIGSTLLSAGRASSALPDLERAYAQMQVAGDTERDEARLLGLITSCYRCGDGTMEQLADFAEGCREWARARPGRFLLEASSLSFLGVASASRGDFARGRAYATEAVELIDERSPLFARAYSRCFVGEIELLAGDPIAAEKHIRTAYEMLVEAGDKGQLCTVAAWLAEALAVQGRFEEAIALAETGRDAASVDDYDAQVRWRLAYALADHGAGDQRTAERFAREAVELAENTEDLEIRAQAWLRLAQVLDGAPDAESPARRALALSESKGDAAGACRAKTLLERLGSPA